MFAEVDCEEGRFRNLTAIIYHVFLEFPIVRSCSSCTCFGWIRDKFDKKNFEGFFAVSYETLFEMFSKKV